MTDNEVAFAVLVVAAAEWAKRMDQWEKFQFTSDFGYPVYVTISFSDGGYPDSFDKVSPKVLCGLPKEPSDD